jgi:hypothetical protein
MSRRVAMPGGGSGGRRRRRSRRRGQSGHSGCLSPRRTLQGAGIAGLFTLYAMTISSLWQWVLVPLAGLATIALLLLSLGLTSPMAADLMIAAGRRTGAAVRSRVRR